MRIMLFPGTAAFLFLLANASPALAQTDIKIKKSIAAGVKFLKSVQQSDGRWSRRVAGQQGQLVREDVGATALAAVALLEAGMSPKDRAIQRAADVLRGAVPNLSYTYALSLSILFFDRFGDEKDEKRIRVLALRLIAGQNSAGGWTYDCPLLTAEQDSALFQSLTAKDKPNKESAKDTDSLFPAPAPPMTGAGNTSAGDNSNTQFALLALWVARRHGVPSEGSLRKVGQYFRTSQSAHDGGWSYKPAAGPATPAMTCAGLLGLAAAASATESSATDQRQRRLSKEGVDVRALNADDAVQTAKNYLASVLEKSPDQLSASRGQTFSDLYSLWSLERVAVVYRLSTLGQKNWYRWGSRVLAANQRADGSWHTSEPGVIDTSFALLFLSRSNFTTDLRARFQGVTKLRSGAVGGASPKLEDATPATPLDSAPVTKKITPAPFSESTKTEPPKTSPPAAEAPDPFMLASELPKAPPARRKEIIEILKGMKGSDYTLALAEAIPELDAESQRQAREALGERLARMTAKTLREYLEELDPELRRAAVVACRLKEDKQLIPDLVNLLLDDEAEVAAQAHQSLKKLTGLDYGPAPKANEAAREKAQARWQAWWDRNAKKFIKE